MSDHRLNADVEQYRLAAAMNAPPPQVASDPLVAGVTPVEQLLRVLGLAANLGDPQDNATSAEQHAERDAKTLEAAEKFGAQDGEAAAELTSIDGEPYVGGDGTAAPPDPATAMAQQLPQLAAGLVGALAGAVGGVLQPLAQIPQQVGQGAQQAIQTGLLGQTTDAGVAPFEDTIVTEDPPAADFGAADGGFGGSGTGGMAPDIGEGYGGGGGPGPVGGGTAPMAHLGPPPVPSAGTAPASAPMRPVTPAATAPAGPAGTPGMAGMPLVPPGAMGGSPGADKDPKAETKRVSVPPVRNGAPVQGRLTTLPTLPPVVTKTEGKPVVTRRIVAPAGKQSDDAKSDS